MASSASLAVRRAVAEERLQALAERVNARRSAPVAPPARWSKDPGIAACERLEWAGALLTALLAPPAEDPHPNGPPPEDEPGAPAAPAAAASGDAPTTPPPDPAAARSVGRRAGHGPGH